MHEVRFTNPKVAERVAAWKSGKARFDLSYTNLTSDDLEQLGCDEVVTSRAGIVFIQGNPAEEWIDGIHALARFERFKGIQLKGCELGKVHDAGRRLGDGLKRCGPFVGLKMAFNDLNAQQLGPLFARLPFLGCIDLSGNDFDEVTDLASAMQPLQKLGVFTLGFNYFDRIAPLVSAGVLRDVFHLHLWECANLTDADSLAPLSWRSGGNLQFVDLRGCTAWAERLGTQPTLQLSGGENSDHRPLFSIPA